MPIGSWRKRSASQNLNGMLLAEELPVALARCRLDGSGPPFPIEPPIRLGGGFELIGVTAAPPLEHGS